METPTIGFSEELASLRRVVREQQVELAEQQSALERAEAIRRLTLSRCHQFRTTFEEQLELYRGQRAWRVMLWCRKAYALAFASEWSKKLQLFEFMIRSLAGRPLLEDQELPFPSLPAYMPPQIMRPFDSQAPERNSFPMAGGTGILSDLPTLPRPKAYDIVVLAIIDFEFRYQRPQQLAARFAQEGHRVFWVSPTRYLPPNDPQPYNIRELGERLWEIHLRGEQPDIYRGALSEKAAKALAEALAAIYRDGEMAETCVLVQLPFWRKVALEFRAACGVRVVYDCMDDWDTFPDVGSFNIAEERSLASEADVLLVTAQRLVEKFNERGLAPILVRNAADFEFFSKYIGEQNTAPRKAGHSVGYFGAIASWMDLNLLYRVARSRPQYSFVLIGKVFDCDVSRLASLPNVKMRGHKEYSDLPSCLREFDVCLIPFLVNQVTNATDPVKLYEYFSQGKPTVATPMSELLALGDLVYIGATAEEFANKIDQAIFEDSPQLRKRRMDFAASNTWHHRYEHANRAIREAFPSVSIIIVTYNSGTFLDPCLRSVLQNTAYPNFDVILVDSGSQDETPAIINRYAAEHKNISGFCLSENRGFAASNNLGITHSDSDYIVFLNADTLVTPGWLEILMRHHRKDPSIGLVTAVTNFAGNEIKVDVEYTSQMEMERFASSLNRAHLGKNFDVAVAPLYCVLVARHVWNAVGELDEGFGIGMFEDDDYSMRVRVAGYRVVVAEDCFIHHFGQGSFSQLKSAEYNETFERNRRLYERKWSRKWTPHQPRNGVRPASEETRFEPRAFCKAVAASSMRESV